MLLWKDRVAFWALEHRRNALVGILIEMLKQQRLFLEHRLTGTLKD